MSSAEKFRDYAADCVRKAGDAAAPEDKVLLLNMGLAWMRLAQQVEAVGGIAEEARELGLPVPEDGAAAT